MKKLRYIRIIVVAVTVVLLTVLLLSILAVASDSCGLGLEWSIDSETGVLSVTGKGEITSAPWRDTDISITEVIIGEGVTAICDGAFFRCADIEIVRLPSTLKKIGYQAFEDCVKIREVHITDLDAFATITYDEVQPGSFEGNPLFSGASLYLNGNIVRRVELSASVTKVSPYVFYGSTDITEVILHDGIASVGRAAFYGCENLRRVTVGESVAWIDEDAFGETYNLIEVYNLSSLPIAIGREDHGEVAKSAVVLNTSRATPSILSVNEDGFAFAQYGGVTYLVGYDGGNTSLTLPADYKGQRYTVRSYAFYNNRRLTSVTIPNTVDMIQNNAFLDADGLRDFAVSDGVLVGDGVIVSGKNLRTATIPYNYNLGLSERLWKLVLTRQTSLGEGGFDACPNLLSFTIPETVESINSIYGLSGGRLLEIYNLSENHIRVAPLGAGLPAATTATTIHSSLDEPSAIIEEDGFLFYDVTQGFVKYKGQQIATITVSTRREADYMLVGYVGESNIPAVPTVINQDASARVVIRDNAFSELPLRSITLSERIVGIGYGAFGGCESLASISLPDTLEYIGSYAFEDCPEELFFEDNGSYYIGKYFIYADDSTRDIIIKDGTKGIADGKTSTTVGARKYERIFVPSSVRFIGRSAFFAADYLREVTISEGVECIEENVFMWCEAIESISIPSSVTKMGKNVFEGCVSLKNVTWNTTISTVPEATFLDCTSLVNITLPDTVTKIDGSVFKNCTALVVPPIPEGVTDIGGNAFAGCTSLRAVHLSKNVTSLASTAFSGCTALSSLTVDAENPVYHSTDNCIINTEKKILMVASQNSVIPTDGSVTSFADGVFKGLTLPGITIPAEVTNISPSSFEGTTFDTLLVEEGHPNYVSSGNCLILKGTGQLVLGCRGSVIPTDGSVTVIANDAFRYATAPSSVTIPASVTYIGGSAFYNAYNLKALIFEKTDVPITIRKNAFYNNPITELILNRPSILDAQSFGNLSQMTKIWLHEDIEVNVTETLLGMSSNPFSRAESVADVSFADMDALLAQVEWFSSSGEKTLRIRGEAITDLVIPDGTTIVPILKGANIRSLTIPASVTQIKQSGFRNCYYLESIIFNATNCTIGNYAFEDCGIKGEGITVTFGSGVTNIPASIFASYAYPAKIVNVVFPDNLISIGESAFYGCAELGEINLPQSLQSIGGGAFGYCSSIKSVTLGDNIRTLGAGVFHYCTSLVEAHFPNHLTEIPDSTFFACKSLVSFTLPASCEVIGSTAFSSCLSLSSVTLSNNLRVIGSAAFILCPSLTSIDLPDTLTEIGEEAFAQGSLVTLTIPASVNVLGKNILRSTKLSLLTLKSPTIFAAMRAGNMSDFAHVGGILVPAALVREGDALDHFSIIEDYTDGGAQYKLFVEHTHIWGNGKEIEDPSEPCEKDWDCSVCRIHRVFVMHMRGEEATCTTDCLCTVCETVLSARLGHDPVYHDGKSPTCNDSGWKAYETCRRCTHNTYEALGVLGHAIIYHSYKAPSCTAIGWEAYETCSRCDHNTYVELGIVPHDIHFVMGKIATCTEDGWMDYEYCSTCTYTTFEATYARGHSIINYYNGKAPTCTAPGWNGYYQCSAASCSLYFTGTTEDTEIADLEQWKMTDGYIPAVPHTPILMDGCEPTCVNAGYRDYYCCLMCNSSYDDEECTNLISDWLLWKQTDGMIPTVPHIPQFVAGETPSCYRNGYKDYYICHTCAHSYSDEGCTNRIDDLSAWKENEGMLPMTPHSPELWAGEAPTCYRDGYADCYICHTCAYFYTDDGCTTQIEDLNVWKQNDGKIPMIDHTPVLHIGRAPTCYQDGYEDCYICPNCNDYFEDEEATRRITDYGNWTCTDGLIPMIPHAPVLMEGLAPTCTESGYAECFLCTLCERNFVDEECEHVINDLELWRMLEGYRSPTNDHTPAESVNENVVQSSCTAYGSYESVTYCTVCGAEVERRYELILPEGHSYADEITVDTPPTCTTNGMSSRHCTKCGERTDETLIFATGHSFGDWQTISPASCTGNGSEKRTCSVCFETEENILFAFGHTPIDSTDVERREPTCEKTGVLITPIICDTCGTELERRSETLLATGHKLAEEWTIGIPATCTSEGIKYRTCLTCGAHCDNTVVQATPHSFTNYVSNTDATCDTDGTKTAKCDMCESHDTQIDVGSARGHHWRDATYDSPKICIYCNATEGEPLRRPEEVTTTKPEEETSETLPSATDDFQTVDVEMDGCSSTLSHVGWIILLLPAAAGLVLKKKKERV